ncbi:MAG: sigma-70 family RNA polymerase sigma factor [Planctomycetia bacterium]|nr:sigma-70 family RNA polymerase sigma factor [Planctomycetia bacterium]
MDQEVKTTEQSDKQKVVSRLFMENIDVVRMTAFCTAPHRQLLGDIVNDSYVDFVQKADQWDVTSDIRPLLRTITRNIALQYWKEHRRSLPEALAQLADRLQQQSSSDETNHRRAAELKALSLCLEGITEENRQILEAHYNNDVPINELARILKWNVNTLYSFFTRLRNALRDCVEGKLKGGFFDAEP